MSTLSANINLVRERMAAAAHRAGRTPDEITLVAVSKTQPAEMVREALALGIRDFGENRVEEGVRKIAAVKLGAWHMIGHVQSRKAREAAGFDYIHSVDSARLAARLGRLAGEARANVSTPLPIFLECNVSGEASKYGLRADRCFEDAGQKSQLTAEVENILAAPGVHVVGLMTLAPIAPEPEMARPVFRRLRRLRDELARGFPQGDWRGLSMGMTDDYEVAIEEGATHVRIGRAIFGERRA